MPSAHEIAVDVLTAFGGNVVARIAPQTYGQYASAIGRDPTKYGMAVGQAMHAIGALCIIQQLPVAPLYWVRRADNGQRTIFENDHLERRHVLESGDIDDMFVVSREYRYNESEFGRVQDALRRSLASGRIRSWSPHEIWHLAFSKRPKDSPLTYYERAMARYRELMLQFKTERVTR